MIFKETKLSGACIIEIERLQDERGYFARSWCRREFEKAGLIANIAQCNVSRTIKKGTLRGMHFQLPPYRETKLVRCTKGAILDVIVDLRPESATHKEWMSIELTEENHTMLYVPQGFGHGFQTLTDHAEVFYEVSEFYSLEHAAGVRYNDPAFHITWPLEPTVISQKDRSWPDYMF